MATFKYDPHVAKREFSILLIALFLSGCGIERPGETETCRVSPLPQASVPPINGYQGTWVKNQEPFISVSDSGFDSGYTSTPRVVFDDQTNTYRTYYTGGVLIDQPGREMFGVAISQTPNGTTTKYNGSGDRGSLFHLGLPGSYDYDRQWGFGTVIKDDGVWKMWTIGDSDGSPAHTASVGYATSQDGLTWGKHYANTPTGAVFEDMECGGESRGVLRFAVLKDTDGYYAFYTTFHSGVIKLAFSEDGENGWRVLGGINSPAVSWVGNVLKDGEIYYLTATKPDHTGVVILASVDKVNWVQYDELNISPEYPWQSAVMNYPFLFKNNGWYLYYTAADLVTDGWRERVGVAVLR